ncbi:hypothetical protein K490DRAFT_21154, partial [Saccharata proteae CBS 121410]
PSPEEEQPVDQQPVDHSPRKTSSPPPSAPSGDNKNKRKRSPSPSEQPPLPSENVPPLPTEEISEDPPLPDEEPPTTDEAAAGQEDDGWDPVWEPSCQRFYFYNRFTGMTTWENPRVPSDANAPSSSAVPPPPGLSSDPLASARDTSEPPAKRVHGGYDPRIHGDYDPNADYALEAKREQEEAERHAQNPYGDPAAAYAAQGTFNRFTGRFQAPDINPDNHNDENKSRRQMNAFFDVNAAANSHNGRSLKADRSNQKYSKKEIKAFIEKKKAKKEEKRRAWLRD